MNTVEPIRRLEDYHQHLLRLDPESRYLRFGYSISDHMIERFLSTIILEPEAHQIFAIYDGEDAVGIGHVSRVGVELAFSVLGTHRRQGIGNDLMAACLNWCREQGYVEGCMVCLSSNHTIRKLAARNGMIMQTEQGETLAKFRLDAGPASDLAV